MLTADNVPEVESNERLSRFVFSRSHINQQTKLLKADAFVPHPYEELSVMRDREATEAEIWAAGHLIGEVRSKSVGRLVSLRGRGDAIAGTYHDQKLKTVPDPVPGNPNHVNVTGWPSKDDKASQKLIALEIAKVAKFVAVQEGET